MPSKIPERYHFRDLSFSEWHRTLNEWLPTLDLDFVEYCYRCKKPLALIELARDCGQDDKWTKPLVELAKQIKLPAYLVFWTGDGKTEICSECKRPKTPEGIVSIRIRKLYPNRVSDTILTPSQYELFLKTLRLRHGSPCYESQDAIALLEIERTSQDYILIISLL